MRNPPNSSLMEVPQTGAAPCGSRDLGPREDAALARGPFVRVMTVVIVAMVVSMAALIYHQWITVREPSSATVVTGDPSMDGAQVEVSGKYGTGPWRVTLGAGNNFETPVLLEPGQYHLSVKHGAFDLERDFVVDRLHMVPFLLPSAVTLTAPSATHDVQATIDGEKGEHQIVDLRIQDSFRGASGAAYLMSGGYHVTAVEQGQVIASKDIYLDRTKTLKIRLGPGTSADE